MAASETSAPSSQSGPPNGSGAAALLSAGIGACTLAVLAIAADRLAGFRTMMVFYRPTGPLSGVTTLAIVAWLAVWAILELRWRKREVNLGLIRVASLVLLLVSLLLTFPPVADIF